ncbi:MAG: SAM-dependent methyltransferase, partial [Sulfolobales archaeon]
KKSESPFYSVAHFISREELYEMISSVGLEIIRALGTLSYGPEEEPRLEEPAIDDGRYSFVCVEARKKNEPSDTPKDHHSSEGMTHIIQKIYTRDT